MVRRALTLLAMIATISAAPGCGKKADSSADASQPAAGAAQTMPEGGGGEAPPSPDEKRRGRRGIETGNGAPAVSLFADAPEPPELMTPPKGAKPAKGPAPAALAEGTRAPSHIALLAFHLKTMRKLRAGILSEKAAVTVYDAGHKRVTYDRQGLLNTQGRWLSAKVSALVPKPADASVEGAVGTITAGSLGWRLVYVYAGKRWRWAEVWRDRR